jgi:hypothetical protein
MTIGILTLPMNAELTERRLLNQCITGVGRRRPADVVAWCGAVQAQEYEAAKWGLGLRLQDGAIDADVERAFAAGRILRTHVMRPTWHFVTPHDIRWLLELTAPRVHRIVAVYNRKLELDAATLVRTTAAIERALRDGHFLTRPELGEQLQRSAARFNGLRLAFVTMYAELEGVICSGPRRGKQFTYALVDERAPGARRLERDEALAELSRRFFSSHGPATIRDFVWWSGLTTADAKRGLEMNKARREDAAGKTYWSINLSRRGEHREHIAHLLPIYDEYLVAYRDREVVPHGPGVIASGSPAPVTFRHALVIAGQVAGTWRLTKSSKLVALEATAMRRLSERERLGLASAARRYESFHGAPVKLSIQAPAT